MVPKKGGKGGKKVVSDSTALISSSSFNSDFLELSVCLDLTDCVIPQTLGLEENSLEF